MCWSEKSGLWWLIEKQEGGKERGDEASFICSRPLDKPTPNSTEGCEKSRIQRRGDRNRHDRPSIQPNEPPLGRPAAANGSPAKPRRVQRRPAPVAQSDAQAHRVVCALAIPPPLDPHAYSPPEPESKIGAIPPGVPVLERQMGSAAGGKFGRVICAPRRSLGPC